MGKADKMLGGNKVTLPKVEWSVHLEVGERIDGRGDQIAISGSATDGVTAALEANKARQAIHDALNADKALTEAGKTGK